MARHNEAAIKSEIDNRQFAQAEADLREVLVEKPQSAKAHYWLGQVLGYEGRTSDGLAEIEKARSIDPQLGFTTADHFQHTEATLRASLAGQHPAAAPAAPPQSSMSSALNRLNPASATAAPAASATQTPTPAHAASTTTAPAPPHIVPPKSGIDAGTVIMIGIVILVIYFVFRSFRNRQMTQYSGMPGQGMPGGMPGGAPGFGNNYPPGYGYGPQQSSGLGGVIPGVLGGVVLGEMLAHHNDAGATVIHDVVHDQQAYTPAPDNSSSGFDAGSDDGGSFGGGGDSGGGNFDSGGGGDF